MPIYMQMGPADKFGNIISQKVIKGTSKDEGHVGWIPLSSFVFAKGRSVVEPDSGTVISSLRDAVCTRLVDGTSTTLFRMAFSSSETMAAIIDFVKDGDVILQLKLSNVVLSSYSSVNAKEPMETFSMNFTRLEFGSKGGMTDANETGTPDRAYYDLTQQTGS